MNKKKLVLPIIMFFIGLLISVYFSLLLTSFTILNNSFYAILLLPLPFFGYSIGSISSIILKERKKIARA